MPKPKDDGQTYYEMPKTNKTKKKVRHKCVFGPVAMTCGSCTLCPGHVLHACIRCWRRKESR